MTLENYKALKEVIQKANPDFEMAREVPCHCHGDPRCINAPKRPIRLADVLLAYKDQAPNALRMAKGATINTDITEIVYNWNLTDDNLDNQSEETKSFLYELLV